eukprot:1389509-Amorphochlora_amoeboformis.AAC.1
MRASISGINQQELISLPTLEQPSIFFDQKSLPHFYFEGDNVIQKITPDRATLVFDPTLEDGTHEFE